ncbi:hypothetical protein J40TS1_33840 [Paenibacillus montaniterrae]|uniref:Uncharacterized protein n=1 Tax=Paenibacillus montaniterrae TaxID=429341 RepID=A0A919YR42_9BACL|nr:hypothetical protein [Paenibacillus montaniterrae]GIP17742.1 hypothetical protein J40TS1_33840 [Paenibacillus montaniterrae]
MAHIISFTAAKQQREDEQLLDDFKGFLIEIMQEMTTEERMELLNCFEQGDVEKYLSITQPIWNRKVIREINSGRVH